MRRVLLLVGLCSSAAHAATFTQATQLFLSGRNTTLYWETDVSSSTEVGYGTSSAASFSAYSNHSSALGLLGAKHSRTLRGLAPGTYYYRVRSDDGVAPAVSNESTFTVVDGALYSIADLATNGVVYGLATIGSTLYLAGTFSIVWERRAPQPQRRPTRRH